MESLVPSYWSKLIPVSSRDPAFARMEHQIRLALGSVSPHLLRVYAFHGPDQNENWERSMQLQSRGHSLILDSWVSVARLKGDDNINKIDNVVQNRGFRIPPPASSSLQFPPSSSPHSLQQQQQFGDANLTAASQGLMFGTGKIRNVGKGIMEFIHCRIDVGKSFCVENSSNNNNQPILLPNGYDSVYLFKSPEQQQQQVQPYSSTYSTTTPIGGTQQQQHSGFTPTTNGAVNNIDNNNNNFASMPTNNYDPLSNSNNNISAASAVAAGETEAEYFHRYIIFDERRIHADYLVVFEFDDSEDQLHQHQHQHQQYSPNSSLQLPSYSSSMTPHASSSGMRFQQQLRQHQDEEDTAISAYLRSIEAANAEREGDKLRKSQHIARQLETVERMRETVIQNAIEAENEIKRLFAKALFDLHDITQLKLSSLLSEEVELRRRMEEVEWMENFLQYEKSALSPLHFIDAYTQHTKLIKQKLERLGESPADEAAAMIVPDLQVRGEVQVHSESQQGGLQGRPVLVPTNQYDLSTATDSQALSSSSYLDPNSHLGASEAMVPSSKQQQDKCIIS